MDKAFWIDAALEAQRAVIDHSMLEHYAGGGKKIARWDDWKYSLCHFHSFQLQRIHSSTCRRAFDRLAKDGIITRIKLSTSVSYRFPRQVCDVFAEQTIVRLLAMGYSQTEIRQLFGVEAS
jgi:hypothetical protein